MKYCYKAKKFKMYSTLRFFSKLCDVSESVHNVLKQATNREHRLLCSDAGVEALVSRNKLQVTNYAPEDHGIVFVPAVDLLGVIKEMLSACHVYTQWPARRL